MTVADVHQTVQGTHEGCVGARVEVDGPPAGQVRQEKTSSWALTETEGRVLRVPVVTRLAAQQDGDPPAARSQGS